MTREEQIYVDAEEDVFSGDLARILAAVARVDATGRQDLGMAIRDMIRETDPDAYRHVPEQPFGEE
jgi:hypothetical protein